MSQPVHAGGWKTQCELYKTAETHVLCNKCLLKGDKETAQFLFLFCLPVSSFPSTRPPRCLREVSHCISVTVRASAGRRQGFVTKPPPLAAGQLVWGQHLMGRTGTSLQWHTLRSRGRKGSRGRFAGEQSSDMSSQLFPSLDATSTCCCNVASVALKASCLNADDPHLDLNSQQWKDIFSFSLLAPPQQGTPWYCAMPLVSNLIKGPNLTQPYWGNSHLPQRQWLKILISSTRMFEGFSIHHCSLGYAFPSPITAATNTALTLQRKASSHFLCRLPQVYLNLRQMPNNKK